MIIVLKLITIINSNWNRLNKIKNYIYKIIICYNRNKFFYLYIRLMIMHIYYKVNLKRNII